MQQNQFLQPFQPLQPSKPSPHDSYFQTLNTKNLCLLEVTKKHNTQRIQNITKLLDNGELLIKIQPIDVEQLLSKINPEIVFQDQGEKRKKFINRQLEYLRSQTQRGKISKPKDNSQEKSLVFDQKQHKNIVTKFVKERKQLQKKHQKSLMKRDEKRQRQEKKRQQQVKKIKMQQQSKKIQALEKHRQKMKQQHQQFLRREKESQQKYEEYKSKKFLHEQIQERFYTQHVLKGLQEKKQKLKQIRQFKALDMSSLKQHEKQYLQQRQISISRKKQDQWNYVAPKRSERIERILEEQRMEKISKMEEKKKNLDEKISRRQYFASYLRQNFAPVVDPKKKLELQQKIKKQLSSKPNQTINAHELGKNYLEQCKKKRKKSSSILRPQSQRLTPYDSMTIDLQRKRTHSNYTNYLQHKNTEQHFQRKRRKNLQKIINTSNISQNEKIKLLQLQSNKINQVKCMKQKQLKFNKGSRLEEDSLELLLSSIHAKVGIIQSYK